MSRDRKRRKLDHRIEEITFDPAAREEYLTGFHKRKQDRIQQARDHAVKRAREEKIKERRQIREQRKEELDRHVAAVQAELRKHNDNVEEVESGTESTQDEVWNGIEEAKPIIEEEEEEYVDEDKYTTVTVEAMDQEFEDEGRASHEDSEKINQIHKNGRQEKRPMFKNAASSSAKKTKKKKQKFRYESKADRAATRAKQKLKNARAAKDRKAK